MKTAAELLTGVNPPSFALPLRIPPTLRPVARTDDYDLYQTIMRPTAVTIVPGLSTPVYSFDGEFPGPTIVASRGRPIVVERVNALGVPVATHLHGGHVPADSDGHPKDPIQPGGRRRYYYPNDQLAAPLWYHDHAMMVEAENVYRGLAGFYKLTSSNEDKLPLPAGRYDVPLLLRDAQIADDGTLVWDLGGFSQRNLFLVNGRHRPYFQVAARKYRLRFVNVSVSRAFGLQLGDGGEMIQIASDGGLLPRPAPTSVITVWPAERAEAVVDFSRYPVGTSVVLQNGAAFPGEEPAVMRFDVVRKATDDSEVPSSLRPVPVFGTPTVERTFVMTFDPATGQMLINGKTFDMDRVDISPTRGTTEVWTIVNPADQVIPIPHVFHAHLEQFRVLDRNGNPPDASEQGLKDTVRVLPGETVRILIRFTRFTGRYLYHCHMLEHSHLGMMGQMEIVAPA